MGLFAAFILIMLTIAIVVVMVRDAISGTAIGVSTRNVFLVGFIYFQTISGAITILTGENERGLYLNSPDRTGLAFSMLCLVFIFLFLLFYRLSGRVFRRVSRVRSQRVLGVPGFAMLAIIGLAVGLLLRFVVGYVPVVGPIAVQLSVGCITVSCCLVVYQWAQNFWNLFIFIFMAIVVAVAVAALLVNAFGRREILGVFMSMAWMLYFLKWRNLPAHQLLIRSVFWTTIILISMVVFSAARSGKEKERSVGDYVQAVARLSPQDLWEQVVGGFVGQFAGGTSMWVYETRPENYPYEPLHSVIYVVTFPIPRQYWVDKPNSLGRNITTQSGVGGVSTSEHSFGPGLIGHIVNDYPPVSLPLYALLLAAMFRYLDNRLAANQSNPFELAIPGVGISQLFALARGELGLFVINAVGTMVGGAIIVAIAPMLSREVLDPASEIEPDGERESASELA